MFYLSAKYANCRLEKAGPPNQIFFKKQERKKPTLSTRTNPKRGCSKKTDSTSASRKKNKTSKSPTKSPTNTETTDPNEDYVQNNEDTATEVEEDTSEDESDRSDPESDVEVSGHDS